MKLKLVIISALVLMGAGCANSPIKVGTGDSATTTSATSTFQVPPNTIIVPPAVSATDTEQAQPEINPRTGKPYAQDGKG